MKKLQNYSLGSKMMWRRINPKLREEWRVIDGYQGKYEVSSFGRVRNKKRGRILIQTIFKGSGYKMVGLISFDGKICVRKHWSVHRLVAINFLPTQEGKNVVDHIDENKLNNRVDNLQWTTNKENAIKYVRTNKVYGLNHKSHKLKKEQILEIRRSNESQRKLASKFGVCQYTIWAVKNYIHYKYVTQDTTKA